VRQSGGATPLALDFSKSPLRADPTPTHDETQCRVGGRAVIATGSDEATARVRDPVTGLPLARPFIGHDGGVNAVAMGQIEGSSVLVTGSADRTVRVWDAVTGQMLTSPLIGHDDWVLAVSIGRVKGRDIIVTGAADHALMVYEYRPGNRFAT
jgi:WD40 repeat protein